MLDSILITEQVETLHLFSLRTEAYAQFDPNLRIGGNLTSIFSKDRNLFSIRPKSPKRWKPYVYFLLKQKLVLGLTLISEKVETLRLFSLRTEAYARFDPNYRTGGNLMSIFSKDRSLCSIRP